MENNYASFILIDCLIETFICWLCAPTNLWQYSDYHFKYTCIATNPTSRTNREWNAMRSSPADLNAVIPQFYFNQFQNAFRNLQIKRNDFPNSEHIYYLVVKAESFSVARSFALVTHISRQCMHCEPSSSCRSSFCILRYLNTGKWMPNCWTALNNSISEAKNIE